MSNSTYHDKRMEDNMIILDNLIKVVEMRKDNHSGVHYEMCKDIKKELVELSKQLTISQAVLIDLAVYDFLREYKRQNRIKQNRLPKKREPNPDYIPGYLESQIANAKREDIPDDDMEF